MADGSKRWGVALVFPEAFHTIIFARKFSECSKIDTEIRHHTDNSNAVYFSFTMGWKKSLTVLFLGTQHKEVMEIGHLGLGNTFFRKGRCFFPIFFNFLSPFYFFVLKFLVFFFFFFFFVLLGWMQWTLCAFDHHYLTMLH